MRNFLLYLVVALLAYILWLLTFTLHPLAFLYFFWIMYLGAFRSAQLDPYLRFVEFQDPRGFRNFRIEVRR